MRLASVALASALAFIAAPSWAAVHFTFTGFASGSDNGYTDAGFGAPFGTSPSAITPATGEAMGQVFSQPFVLSITLDTSGPSTDYPVSRVYEGFDADSPATAVFTLNGVSYSFGNASDTSAYSGLEKQDSSDIDAYGGYFTSTRSRPPIDGPFTEFTGLLIFSMALPSNSFTTLDFEEPYTAVEILPGFGGLVQVELRNTFGSPDRYLTGLPRIANLNLTFQSLAVTSDPPVTPGTVPEPATWAMMILGFSAVGASIRRRSRVAKLAV